MTENKIKKDVDKLHQKSYTIKVTSDKSGDENKRKKFIYKKVYL